MSKDKKELSKEIKDLIKSVKNFLDYKVEGRSEKHEKIPELIKDLEDKYSKLNEIKM